MPRPVTKLKDIENAAFQLFAKKGVTLVTIKDIARTANCAEGALYRHYKSKEDFAWALLKREVEGLGLKLKKELFAKGSYKQRVRNAIKILYTYYDEQPVKFSFTLLFQNDFPSKKGLIIEEYLPYSLIVKFIKRGTTDGVFKVKDFSLITAMVIGAILQPPTNMAVQRLTGSMQNKVEPVTKICLKMLGVKD
ncbi:MAG TPA: TetR/AcrR family transcriptional regulator [Spirochaetota bacterium]|nr:TetR/AcrR family transcriptional regulator [Spirochaetota bacterium]